jgi:hypothetical protein
MFFKTFAEKQIESKGRDYDDDMRKARVDKARAWDAVAEKNAEIKRLREVLKAVDHTLTVHGHIDRETPLHDRITSAVWDGDGNNQ